jgi:hypothetical protein
VFIGERLRGADDLVQVRVHELVHHVHIIEFVPAGGHHNVHDGNDVLMAQMPEQLDFPQGAPGIGQVLKRVPWAGQCVCFSFV